MATTGTSSSSAASGAGATGSGGEKKVDPILRNAIRYTVSVREYRALHEFLRKRAPRPIEKRAPQPEQYEQAVASKDDFNAAAVRSALRVFVAAQTGLKAYDVLVNLIMRRGQSTPNAPRRILSPNVRLSLSLSSLVLLHRVLHRFFTRMRANLLTHDAAPFRRRNPRIARALTSSVAPAIGSSLAGLTLGAYPADQFRLTVAIYVASRTGEFIYNALEDEGWFKSMPWLTSALLMPPAFGQLLHAFVFDRDCFPAPFGNFILRFSDTYIQPRPAHLPASVQWPGVYEVVDCLAETSRMKYPAYVSPVLFPESEGALPASLKPIAPVIARAHPAISSLTCAILHPSDPSCVRTFVQYWLNAFPRLVRLFAIIFGALSLLKWKTLKAAPVPFLNALAKRVLKMSAFVAGAIGMGWSTICAFQALLPRTVLPTQRWFWGGFIGGLWGFLLQADGRGQFLYCARQSMDSTWKVGKKHGWWKGIKNGDLFVVCASLAVANAVFDRNNEAMRSRMLKRGMYYLRGEDPPVPETDKEKDKSHAE